MGSKTSQTSFKCNSFDYYYPLYPITPPPLFPGSEEEVMELEEVFGKIENVKGYQIYQEEEDINLVSHELKCEINGQIQHIIDSKKKHLSKNSMELGIIVAITKYKNNKKLVAARIEHKVSEFGRIHEFEVFVRFRHVSYPEGIYRKFKVRILEDRLEGVYDEKEVGFVKEYGDWPGEVFTKQDLDILLKNERKVKNHFKTFIKTMT